MWTTILIILLVIKLFNSLTNGVCKSNVCLIGKTALITGGNSGYGYYTALGLASRGCRVIIASRNNTEEIKNKLIAHSNNPNIVIKHVDFTSLDSVRKLAEDIIATENRLDILINNSRACGLGNKKINGLHVGMQVNHFASFLLTHLLIDLLKKSSPSRIIFTSSAASFANNLTVDNLNNPRAPFQNDLLTDLLAFTNSKLCNIITANGYAEKLKDSGVTVNSLNPGIVNTYLIKPEKHTLQTFFYWLMYNIIYKTSIFSKTPYQASQTIVHLAVSNSLINVTGKHFWDCVHSPWFVPRCVRNQEFCTEIWEETERLLEIRKDPLTKINGSTMM